MNTRKGPVRGQILYTPHRRGNHLDGVVARIPCWHPIRYFVCYECTACSFGTSYDIRTAIGQAYRSMRSLRVVRSRRGVMPSSVTAGTNSVLLVRYLRNAQSSHPIGASEAHAHLRTDPRDVHCTTTWAARLHFCSTTLLSAQVLSRAVTAARDFDGEVPLCNMLWRESGSELQWTAPWRCETF